MTLRKKTLLITAITICIMNAILFAASQMILTYGVKTAETEQSRRNMERVLDSIETVLFNLDMTAFELAAWDDTYEFAEDVNQGYIDSNLTDAKMAEAGFNYILYVNTETELIYGRGFDLSEEVEMPVPQELLNQFTGNGLLLNLDHEVETGKTGILSLPDGPLLFASRPILPTNHEGPVHGSMLLARYLSESEFKGLAAISDLSLQVLDLNDPDLPSEFQNLNERFPEPGSILVDRLNSDKIAVYTVIPDITGAPSTVLRIDTDRTLYQNAKADTNKFTRMLLATGLLLGAIMLVFLEKTVLSRVSSLMKPFNSIQSAGNKSDRVNITGRDEIAVLGMEINKTLDSLDQSRDALISKTTQLQTLIENQGEGIVILDRDEMFTFGNPAAHRILRLEDGSLVGRYFEEFVDPSILNVIRNIRNKSQQVGSSTFEFKYAVSPDETCTILVTTTPWMDENDKFLGTFEIFRDISDLKHTEKLKAGLAAKSDFLSMVSHELRTPLVPIIGYADMLLSGVYGDLPEEVDEPLRFIRSSADALRSLISDILELSKTEHGSLKVSPRPVEVSGLIDDILKPYHEIDQGKPVEFTIESGKFVLDADPVRLKQILHNLINNSIKYSGDNLRISIRTFIIDRTGVISLSDNGIGIHKKELPHIFEGFFQAERSLKRSRGGAGLGLAIVKNIIEAMKGTITVESRYGHGSTFTITLPLAGSSVDTLADTVIESADPLFSAANELSAHQSAARILVVDDDPVSGRILSKMLEHNNYLVTLAISGRKGLEQVWSNPEFDLILLDWNMPEIDGLAVLLSLKTDEATKDIPVVFISGTSEREIIDSGIEHGAIGFLSKPFYQQDVQTVVEKALSSKEPVPDTDIEPIEAGVSN